MTGLFTNFSALASFLLAYLLGSIPFGYVIVRFREGRDIRASGSGNIGATNVARSAGAALGAVTLLLDGAKGYAAVWLARWLTHDDPAAVIVAAGVAIVAHMFPVWLRFKGGKGVATGAGAFLPICPEAVAGALAVWIVAVGITRYVSLGSIIAAAALPLLVYVLYRPPPTPLEVGIGSNLCAVLIIWKHRDNLRRIVAGNENRLKLKR